MSQFLGIVTGTQTIEVAVADDVAAVELRLDGARIAELDRPPWRAVLDFGQNLSTHRLTAVALGDSGEEISRAVQLLNVPREHVETQILLEEWIDGSPTVARLVWHSVEASEPEHATVTLDGTLLPALDLHRIELPRLDPESFHFLAVELMFPNHEIAAAEVVFGGGYGATVETELTAVPIRLESRKLRPLEAAQSLLRRVDGSELESVAVDDGAAEIAVVREDAAILPLARLAAAMRQSREVSYGQLRLGPRYRLRFVSTRPSRSVQPTVRYSVFPVSRGYGPEHGTVPALLAGVAIKTDGTPLEQLTNAIAVAGQLGVERQQRRATLVVMTDCASVSGHYRVDAIRGYLAELHVPLVVWQLGRVRPDQRNRGLCEGAEEIRTLERYRAAVLRLRKRLDRQRIVWVRGRHLPREVEVLPGVRDIALVGR